jgi:hypothetical protein
MASIFFNILLVFSSTINASASPVCVRFLPGACGRFLSPGAGEWDSRCVLLVEDWSDLTRLDISECELYGEVVGEELAVEGEGECVGV